MASVSGFRNGMAINHNNDIWVITEFQHVKPGKGQAFIRTKLKNAKTGRVIDHTFRLTDKIQEVRLDNKEMQYLYATDDQLYFMDTQTYDQVNISDTLLGDRKKFLKEGNMCQICFTEEEPITAELPNFIDLEVVEAEPGVKGDTASAITKNAVLETGANVQVPIFIKIGNILKIDSRTGKYLERVN